MNLWWKIQLVVLLKLIFKSKSFINCAVDAVNVSMGLDNLQWFFIGSTMADLKSLRQGSNPDNYTTTAASQGTTTIKETYPPLLYISHYPLRRQNNTLEANKAMALANVLILPVNDPERIRALRTLGKRPRIGNMLYDWIKDLNHTKLRTIDPRFLMDNSPSIFTTQKPMTLYSQVEQELSSKIYSGWSVYDYKGSNWDEMKKIQEKMKSKSTAFPASTTEVVQVTLFKPDVPIVAKARAVMAQHFVGYLSAFMSTLCEIIGTKKEGGPAVQLAKGTYPVIKELLDGGYLGDIGHETRHALEDYVNYLIIMNAVQVDAQTEKCTQMFRDHSYLENDTLVIIEEIESWYTMDEGEDLLAALVIVDGFPENKMSNVNVVRKVASAILKPYYRIEANTNTKAYPVMMLIEAAISKRKMYLRSKSRSKQPVKVENFEKIRQEYKRTERNKHIRKRFTKRHTIVYDKAIDEIGFDDDDGSANKNSHDQHSHTTKTIANEYRIMNNKNRPKYSNEKNIKLTTNSYNNKGIKIFIDKMYKKLNALLRNTSAIYSNKTALTTSTRELYSIYSNKKQQRERTRPKQNAEQSRNKNNLTLESNIRYLYSVTKAYKQQKNEHYSRDGVELNKKYDSDNNRRFFSNTYDLDNVEYENVDDDDITIEELTKDIRNNRNAEKTLKTLTTPHKFLKLHESTNVGIIPIYVKSMYITKMTEFNSMKNQSDHEITQQKFYDNFLNKKETRRKSKRLLMSKNVLKNVNSEVLSYSDEESHITRW